MTTLTIKVPASITLTRRNGATVTVDPSTLHSDILADLFTYGLRQKLFDSASGNPEQADAQAAMETTLAKLSDGDWTIRNAATNADPLDKYRIAIVRELMASGNSAKVKAAYEDIPSDDQPARRAFIMSVATKNAEHIDPVAKKRLAADEKRNAELSAVSIAM